MDGDTIKILWLYSRLMNLYGDRGNVMCLTKRAEWRGKKVVLEEYDIGMQKPDWKEVDLIFFGGGQDQQQLDVGKDLQKIGSDIKKQIEENGMVMLCICGGLQLMANYYETIEGQKIDGAGVFDAYTIGGNRRFIGNILAKSKLNGVENKLVGFENHSGRTFANWEKCQSLGEIISGEGNNGEDKTEGLVYKNAVGSYLHGCLLPKNPWLADWLLQKAFEKKYGHYQLEALDDKVEIEAAEVAMLLAKKVNRVNNITSSK